MTLEGSRGLESMLAPSTSLFSLRPSPVLRRHETREQEDTRLRLFRNPDLVRSPVPRRGSVVTVLSVSAAIITVLCAWQSTSSRAIRASVLR